MCVRFGKEGKIPSGGEQDGNRESNSESIHYIGPSPNQKEDEEHATCVPTIWKTTGINSTYHYLLKYTI